MNFPTKVYINEVVLRDGLQLEKKLINVEEKEHLFKRLKSAGVQSFEFGSFVHPVRVPQMANSGELYSKIQQAAGDADLIALVPNLKGAERAAQLSVKNINYVFSVSETHNLQNVQKTTLESLEELHEISDLCIENKISLDVSLATSFGCPFEGEIPTDRIVSIVHQVTELNINTLTLADTTGMANPKRVFQLISLVRSEFPKQKLGLHFHNTRDMGLSNILAGMNAGVSHFDTALGGLGGCPFAPGATGNVCTEDVVHMLHSMDIQTNVDLKELLKASHLLEEIVGHQTPSYLLKAGPYDKKYPVPVST
ncbi:hydroxymethylglutaryl-CoA lyase [Psychrobacillus lasiicapitis]|uniref:Hydroxymethylglutaryl-CoA lyase n=1 Tax=Psychrobacillus lasiicapitis TaxID=1636719 RepID=A0A544T2W9_9BACI|nr:hydroxymethylglutaryl-CoA lyase [Psychrobacillus lasiicapitis]TQR11816.1 hydroxymethylglutaryl-CoA lyase [Psychrobacillus lasiicapitis]GGA19685.1 hydroxymethylglutaryl-CoA lyase [Psychrobacillus lasiicapitis]